MSAVVTSPSSSLAPLNAGEASRSPEGTAMHAASSRMHIASGAGLGAARRSAQYAAPSRGEVQ